MYVCTYDLRVMGDSRHHHVSTLLRTIPQRSIALCSNAATCRQHYVAWLLQFHNYNFKSPLIPVYWYVSKPACYWPDNSGCIPFTVFRSKQLVYIQWNTREVPKRWPIFWFGLIRSVRPGLGWATVYQPTRKRWRISLTQVTCWINET